MNYEDYDLDRSKRQRIEQIETELVELDRREEQLLQELASVVSEEQTAP